MRDPMRLWSPFAMRAHGAQLYDALALFEGGYAGRLIEATSEHMYSDAGVTPAAIGEAVHSIREQVGGGLISQTTLADRGIRSTTGVVLDGVSDKYPTGWTVPSSGPFTLLMAFDVAAEPTAATSLLFGGMRSGVSNRCAFAITKTTGAMTLHLGATGHTLTGDYRGQALPFAMVRNAGATSIKAYVGSEIVVTDNTGAALSLNPLMIGTRDGTLAAADWASGTFRAMMTINRELTEAQIMAVLGRWQQILDSTFQQPAPPYSVVMHYGQSNSVGLETTAESIYTKHGNRSFGKSLESWVAESDIGGVDRTTTQLLRERVYESGMNHGLGRLVDRKLADIGETDWRMLGRRYFAIHPGVNGVNIETLTTSSHWDRAALDINGSRTVTGSTSSFDWLWWVHGFSNASDARGAYAPKLVTLIDKIKAQAVTDGYAGANPRTVIGQMCQSRQASGGFPSVSLSQLAVADADATVDIFPLYQVQWKNGTHMSTLGQKMKGEYFAKTMLDIEDGTYAPVRWSVSSWTDTEIVLAVTGGTGTYAFDTTNIPAVANMGFDVWASDDTTLQNIISGVSLVGSVITISLSAPAPTGARLGYGWGRSGMTVPNNSPYALGNLRDNDSRTALISGTSYPLYNWCLIMDAVKP